MRDGQVISDAKAEDRRFAQQELARLELAQQNAKLA
jgi:hypothetical protein